MNSKKNSFKRVAAGTLAVLTVAAYTAPVANVGGLPSINALVADAADAVEKTTTIQAKAYNYITSITDGTTTLNASTIKSTKLTSADLVVGSQVTVTSTVPLNITTLPYIINDTVYGYVESENRFYDKNDTKTSATSGYVLDGGTYYKIVSEADVIKATVAITDSDKLSDSAKSALYKGCKANGKTMEVNVIGTMTETKKSSTYTYKFTMPDDGVDISLFQNTVEFVAPGTGKTDTAVLGAGVTISDTITTNTKTAEGYTASGFVAGDTIKLSSTSPFKASINDEANDKADIEVPDMLFADGKYYCEFDMPKSAKVKITLEDVVEEYTYSVSGNKLLMSTKSGSIKNAAVAAINVTYTDKDSKTVTVADNGEVANGFTVKTATTLDKGTLEEFEVTKNGAVVATAAPFNATAAGKYEVTYKVKVDGNVYKLTQNFTIAAKTALTASNVKLVLKDGNTDTNNIITANIADFTKLGKASGVVEFTYNKEQSEKHGTFEVLTSLVDNDGNPIAATFDVNGYESGSTLDKTYSITIQVTDPEYGGSASSPKNIELKWRVNSFGSSPQFNNNTTVTISKENVADLEDKIVEAVSANDAAKKKASEFTYEYVEGEGAAITEDELDEREAGLPKTTGTYTVYVSYNEEVKARVIVKIAANTLTYTVKDSALKLTYSDEFDISQYVLKDSAGKTVTSVKATDPVYTIKLIDVDAKGNLKKDEEGNYVTVGADVSGLAYLSAGTYELSITSAKSSDEAKYSIAGTKQVITVAKKNLSNDIVSILPIDYDSYKHNIVDEGTVIAVDPITGATPTVKITEGSKQSAVGQYTATVALDGTAGANANYTGTASIKWAIVASHVQDGYSGYRVGLDWDDTRTTLYDNGRIHLELGRNANTKVTKNSEKVTVTKFGVVLDKAGKFAEPTYYKPANTSEQSVYNAEVAEVEKQLLVGNGFTEGGYTETTEYKASANTTYKVNVAVKDAQTGMWVRPYAIVKDSAGVSTVVYGETIYLNLQEEAIDKLNLQMPMANPYEPAVRRADLKDALPGDSQIKSGFNPVTGKYYVYTSFKDLEDAGYSDLLEVSDFGVVVDKTGKIYDGVMSGTLTLAEADKLLTIGNGFIEGHYDKANSHLKVNEYAANITPKDSLTPVVVRPYLDLGNGLVIYGDIEYIMPVSEYFNANVTDVVVSTVGGTQKLQLTIGAMTAPTVKDANGKALEVKAVKSGVVLDKSGTLSDTATPEELDKALQLGKGFVEGKKTTDAIKGYSAKVTPVASKLYVRSYVIYDVNGVQITVYGDVVKFNVSSSKKQAYDYVNEKWEDA